MAKPEGGSAARTRLWIVGCGNMGGAMLDRWLATGFAPDQVTIIDPQLSHPPVGVTVHAEPDPRAAAPDIVLLAVKPQMLDAVATTLAPCLTPDSLLVSILAGASLATLRSGLAPCRNIVRAMPNLPVAIGNGVVALHGDVDAETRATTSALMAPLGMVEWLATETQFDAVTALSGSGPAFVCRFIEAMAAGGAALGLDAAQAERMALATLSGTATLLTQRQESPATMARRVTSPNGTTEAGLAILDSEKLFAKQVAATLKAAANRAAELAALASRGTGR